MPTPIPNSRPLDLTGLSSSNLILDEPHTLTNRKVRSIAPHMGPYFTESLEIWDASTNQKLNKGVDFRCLDIVSLPSAQSGKEICSLIVIINTLVSSNVRLIYQALGGGYARSYEPIRNLVDKLTQDTRPLEWSNVINRPLSFEPTMHLHAMGDVIGFEYLVAELESLKNAILLGDQVDHDQLRLYLDTHIDSLTALLDSAQNANGVMALASAQGANTMSVRALTVANSNQVYVQQLEQTLSALNQKADRLVAKEESTEALAKSILVNYPTLFRIQHNTDTNTAPSGQIEHVLQFPIDDAIGFIQTDHYAITREGKVVLGLNSELSAVPETDWMFSVRLTTYKEVSTSTARIDVQVTTYDQRDNTLVGFHGQDCEVTLFPLRLDSGQGNRFSAFCHDVLYHYREDPKDGVIRGGSYGVVGLDVGTPISLQGSAEQMLTAAQRIASHLLDCRADYNVVGYGSVAQRRAVKMTLPQGVQVSLAFRLSGINVSDIDQLIALNFKQTLNIVSSQQVDAQLVSTPVLVGVDSAHVRSLGVSF